MLLLETQTTELLGGGVYVSGHSCGFIQHFLKSGNSEYWLKLTTSSGVESTSF